MKEIQNQSYSGIATTTNPKEEGCKEMMPNKLQQGLEIDKEKK